MSQCECVWRNVISVFHVKYFNMAKWFSVRSRDGTGSRSKDRVYPQCRHNVFWKLLFLIQGRLEEKSLPETGKLVMQEPAEKAHGLDCFICSQGLALQESKMTDCTEERPGETKGKQCFYRTTKYTTAHNNYSTQAIADIYKSAESFAVPFTIKIYFVNCT